DVNEDSLYSYATPKQSDYPLLPVARSNIPDRSYQQEQRLMNRTISWNPTLQEHSAARVSYIEPQFKSPSAAQMVRSNASMAPQNVNQINKADMAIGEKALNASCSMGNVRAKLTSTNIVFLMVGIILCGIPLAVMTTLCSRSSSTATATASSVTVSTGGLEGFQIPVA
ncbi:unnamed protein product, partial [Didymodactylos carnosus]